MEYIGVRVSFNQVKGAKVMKSAVKYVAVNRAEGPMNECGAVIFYVGDVAPVLDRYFKKAKAIRVLPGDIIKQVLFRFGQWGYSAPKEGGYDKCDFAVVWENGNSYEGRFDMQFGGLEDGLNFWASLQSRLEVRALRKRPAHFTDKNWELFSNAQIEDGAKVECEGILDECEIY